MSMGTKEWDPANIFDLFGDPISRCILVSTSHEPRSADEIAERFDVSLPTVYRRTNKLTEYGLMTAHLRADENKNQFKVFESTLERITFEIGDDGYQVEIQTNAQIGDQFESFWTDSGTAADSEPVVPDTGNGQSNAPDARVDKTRFTDHSRTN